MNSPAKKYRLSDKAVFSNIGEEAVILDPKKGSYYGLDEVGVVVWEQMGKSPKSIPELCQAICEIYDVAEQACEEDVKELIQQLEKAGLIMEA